MPRSLIISIVATGVILLATGELTARPGRGGGPGGPGGAGARPSGPSAGSRPSPGSARGQASNRPSTGGAKLNNPGNPAGGFNQNRPGTATNNFNRQFNKGTAGTQRSSNSQLQDFLGKGEAVRTNEFARGERTTQSKEQLHAQASQVQNSVQDRADNLFTPQWYADHPNAWQAAHPHADAWAVATTASLAAWVGTAAYAGSDTVVVESATDEAGETAEEGTTSDTSATSTTATNVEADPAQWLTIGVFALAQQGQTEPTTLVQLSVNKQGTLNGTYYDLVSETGTPVTGQIDTKTQRAAWNFGENSKNVFTTTIETLTSENGPATLNLPEGKTQEWNLIRVNKPTK